MQHVQLDSKHVWYFRKNNCLDCSVCPHRFRMIFSQWHYLNDAETPHKHPVFIWCIRCQVNDLHSNTMIVIQLLSLAKETHLATNEPN